MAKKLWIVEDNAYYLEGILGLLEGEADLECTHSFSSLQTLRQFVRGLPVKVTPDLVLMDVQLNDSSSTRHEGITGTAFLKAHFPDTPIVMLTVNDTPDTIFKALQAGASGYLLKDMAWDRIRIAIQDALLGGMMLPGTVAAIVRDFFQDLNSAQDYQLTNREKEVLALMCDGLSQKKVAERLFISTHTVGNHTRNIYSKLHVHSAPEAVSKAIRERLVE